MNSSMKSLYRYSKPIIISMALILSIFSTSSQSADRFIADEKIHTVKDTYTGLEWQQSYNTALGGGGLKRIKDYSEAINYVSNFTRGVHTDWRLPTVDELRSVCLTRTYAYTVLGNSSDERDQYWTLNEGGDEFTKIYLPYSNIFFTASKYQGGQRRLVWPVRSYKSAPPKTDYASFEPESIFPQQKLVRYDGIAAFIRSSRTMLLPFDINKYPFLTFCPDTAFSLIELSDADFKSKKNGIEAIAQTWSMDTHKGGTVVLRNIKDFASELKKIYDLNKFDLFTRKDEFLNSVRRQRDKYRKEYQRYCSSVFLMHPFYFPKNITSNDYNVDRQTLNINFYPKRINQFRTGKSYGFDSVRGLFHEDEEIFFQSVNVPVDLNIAKQLFTDDQVLQYQVNHYVKPFQRFFRSTNIYNQQYQLVAVTVQIYKNENVPVLDIVFDGFTYVYDEKGRVRNSKWKTRLLQPSEENLEKQKIAPLPNLEK